MYNPSQGTRIRRRTFWQKLVRKPSFWVISGLLFVFVINMVAVKSTGTSLETQMNEDYQQCLVMLTRYYTNGTNALGLASANTQAIDKILTDAASGKYGNKQSLNDPKNGVYTVIVQYYQGYPKTDNVSDAYKNAKDILVGDFDDYSAQEGKLFDDIERYDNWSANFFEGPFIGLFRFPDTTLKAQVDPTQSPLHGQQAYDQMNRVVTDPKVTSSYKTGTLQPMTIPTP